MTKKACLLAACCLLLADIDAFLKAPRHQSVGVMPSTSENCMFELSSPYCSLQDGRYSTALMGQHGDGFRTSGSTSMSTRERDTQSIFESKLRALIVSGKWDEAKTLLGSVTSTRLPSGRDLAYVISETCRRERNLSAILPLLQSIPLDSFSHSTEDDIMPMLSSVGKSGPNPKSLTAAYRIVNFLQRKRVPMSAKAYSVLVKGFGQMQNREMVDRLLSECINNGVKLDLILFNSAVDAYIGCGLPKKATMLFEAVLAKVVTSNGGSINTINSARAGKLEALRDSKQIEALRKKLRGEGVANEGLLPSSLELSTPSPSSSSVNSAAPGTGGGTSKTADDKESAFRSIVKVFAESNIRPNSRSFNTLLKALRGSGEGSFQRCMELVESMGKLNIQPDSVTVNTLVDASVMEGKFEAAEQLLLSPMATPGVEAYTALISGYADNGNVDDAFRILDQMRKCRVTPNLFTLTSLMKTCVVSEDWARARELLEHGDEYMGLKTQTAAPVASVAPATKGSVRVNESDGKRYYEMRKPDSQSKTASSSADVDANPAEYRDIDGEHKRRAVMSALRGSFVIGLCSISTYTEDPLDKELFLNEARRELLQMERDELRPDTATMNAFIQGLCAQPSPRVLDALVLLRAMKREGIEADDITYSILFAALGRVGYVNEALKLFQTAKRRLDAPAINALLGAFAAGPQPMQAVQLFQELLASEQGARRGGVQANDAFWNFEPTKYTFTILFAAIMRALSPSWKRAQAMPLPAPGSGQGERFEKFESNFWASSSSSSSSPSGASAERSVVGTNSASTTSSAYRVNGGDRQSSNVVDTTIVSSSRVSKLPPLSAFIPTSAIGKVFKNLMLGGKSPTAQAPAPSSAESKMRSGPRDGSDQPPSKPLVYAISEGRFYEQNVVEATGVVVPASDNASADENGEPEESLIEEEVDPAISLETETATVNSSDKNAQNEGAAGSPPSKSSPSTSAAVNYRTVDYVSMDTDALTQRLYRAMRYECKIEPDDVMVGALNSLFASQRLSWQGRGVGGGLLYAGRGSNRAQDSAAQGIDSSVSASASSASDSLQSSSTWGRKTALSKATAELVFEDLAISGWHPTQLISILRCCEYPPSKMQELLKDESENTALKKLRASAASVRIFRKHGWNKVESGWSGFF